LKDSAKNFTTQDYVKVHDKTVDIEIKLSNYLIPSLNSSIHFI